MILHVTHAKYLKGFQVELSFNDGRQGTADLIGSLDGPVFERLKNLNYFAQLRLDPELDTISWPSSAYLAPEYLYFLVFKDDPELQDQFQKWGYVDVKEHSSIEGSL